MRLAYCSYVRRRPIFHPHKLMILIVERQMRCNMRIVEALLQSMFFDICTVISARSVKVQKPCASHQSISNGSGGRPS